MSKEINMDIEVGDYVRTKSGKIDRVTNNKFYMQPYIDCERGLYLRENIVKYSTRIKELIEVGDIVNGYRIDLIDPWRVLVHEARGINKSGFSIPVAQYEEDIETILTKEQYSQNCYTVERR